MALKRVVGQVVFIVGPSLAGVVAAGAGVRGCYLADVVSFAAASVVSGRLPAMPPEGGPAPDASAEPTRPPARPRPRPARPGAPRTRSGLALTLEGLAFIRRTPVLCGAFLADVNATFFALPAHCSRRSTPSGSAEPAHARAVPTAIGVGGLVSALSRGR